MEVCLILIMAGLLFFLYKKEKERILTILYISHNLF